MVKSGRKMTSHMMKCSQGDTAVQGGVWSSKVALRGHSLLGSASMPWPCSKEREKGVEDMVMDLQEEKSGKTKRVLEEFAPSQVHSRLTLHYCCGESLLELSNMRGLSESCSNPRRRLGW